MTLEEIRPQIDTVDKEIRELFIRRMHLAEQVARVKAQTEDTIYKPDREKAILENRSKGMEEDLKMEYRALLKRVMEVSRKYQYGLTLQMRDCFPYVYEEEEPHPATVGIIRDQLYLMTLLGCDGALSGQLREIRSSGSSGIHGARNYEELADLIEDGSVDEGIGVIEEIGIGVNNDLNAMLFPCGFFINFCEVIQDGDRKLKVVGFSKTPVVMNHHNRLKIVFTVPNRSGSLASILSMIADYGADITQIHSVPFAREDAEGWNYRFFLELQVNLLKPDIKALVYQLSEETEQMKLLGSYYCVGDFD